jgi:hypothetical protein
MKAFPKVSEYNISSGSEGMDLRDYFACHVMQAIITNKNLLKEVSEYHDTGSKGSIARFSYVQADAMMEARKK